MRHREGLKTGDWAYWHRLLSYYWKLSSPYWKQDNLRLKIPLLRDCEQRSFAALYEQRQIGELPLTEYLADYQRRRNQGYWWSWSRLRARYQAWYRNETAFVTYYQTRQAYDVFAELKFPVDDSLAEDVGLKRVRIDLTADQNRELLQQHQQLKGLLQGEGGWNQFTMRAVTKFLGQTLAQSMNHFRLLINWVSQQLVYSVRGRVETTEFFKGVNSELETEVAASRQQSSSPAQLVADTA